MARIKLKATVRPQSLVILAAVANVAAPLAHPVEVWITSGNDSKHMTGSRHYEDKALDVRSKNFPTRKAKRAFLAAVLLRLGPAYEGFLEQEGKLQEHFHIEAR